MQKRLLELLRLSTPFFASLQEENRQEIVSILFAQGGQSVQDIAKQMRISRPAVCHHLKLLHRAKVVKLEKQGKEHIYSLDRSCLDGHLKAFLALLEEKDAGLEGN